MYGFTNSLNIHINSKEQVCIPLWRRNEEIRLVIPVKRMNNGGNNGIKYRKDTLISNAFTVQPYQYIFELSSFSPFCRLVHCLSTNSQLYWYQVMPGELKIWGLCRLLIPRGFSQCLTTVLPTSNLASSFQWMTPNLGSKTSERWVKGQIILARAPKKRLMQEEGITESWMQAFEVQDVDFVDKMDENGIGIQDEEWELKNGRAQTTPNQSQEFVIAWRYKLGGWRRRYSR